MIEKDNIQELFSKAFENQTAAVKPELWAGVQAKMAAASVASTATVATKGLSALTKWIIGSAAVGTVGVVTTVIALNSGEESTNKKTDSPKEISQNISVTSPEENKTEQSLQTEHTYSAKPEALNPLKPSEYPSHETNPYKETNTDADYPVKDHSAAETVKPDKERSEEKVGATDNSKRESADKRDQNDTKKAGSASDGKGGETVKTPEDTKETFNPENAGKVTNFPNIFSPNGDQTNDTYKVEVKNLVDFKMTIVDERNRPLFQTNDPNEGWDGKIAGEDAKPGSYAVFIDGKDLNGKDFHKAQIFVLMRR